MTAAPEAAMENCPGEIRVLLTQEQSQALGNHFAFIVNQFRKQEKGKDTRWSIAAQVWDHQSARARNFSSYSGEHGQIVVVCIPRERAFLVSPDGFRQAQADRAERDALRAVLTEIVYEYRNSYDADCEPGGSWKAAASLPVDLMERAAKLVGAK